MQDAQFFPSNQDENEPVRVCVPSAGQPGTYGEQMMIVDLVAADPTHHADFDGAMRMARRLVLPKTRLVEVTWTNDFPQPTEGD
jgi:hypothetical protein